MPEFKQIAGRRSRSADRLNYVPRHLENSLEVMNRRRQRNRSVFTARQARYIEVWKETGTFSEHVLAAFEQLRIPIGGGDGQAKKILSDSEVERLKKQCFPLGIREFYGAINPTNEALRDAVRMLDALLESRAPSRVGYRSAVRQWMETKEIATIDKAAKHLGIGVDTLKSIMSSSGTKRYSDGTLKAVLGKIGFKVP